MKNPFSFNQKSLVALAAAFFLSGCAGLSDNMANDGKISVERIDSRVARIAHVQVRSDGSELRVNGDIRKSFQRRGRIPGHLHIKVFGVNGKLLIQTTSRYYRKHTKSQRSHFSESLPVDPKTATKVRVIHHRIHHNYAE